MRSAVRAPREGYTFNPPLLLVTNPSSGERLTRNRSERDVWEAVLESAMFIEGEATDIDSEVIASRARYIASFAKVMLEQLERGVHKNPRARALPRGAERFGSDIQAIVYRNTKVRRAPYRAHVFGGGAFDLANHRDGSLTISGLVDRTGVESYALPDGSVLLRHQDGRPIVDDVPDEVT